MSLIFGTLSRAFNIAIIFVTCLGACTLPPENSVKYDLNFSPHTPIKLKVGKVIVENRSKTHLKNDITMRLPIPLISAFEFLIGKRLRAVGARENVKIRVIIHQSSVLETKLKTDESIRGTFTDQQAYLYLFVMKTSFLVIDDFGRTLAESNVEASESVTTSEGLTLVERDTVLHDTLKRLLSNFDNQMRKSFTTYFSKWLQT